MEQDPVVVMADTLVRLATLETVRVLVWLPAACFVAWLHARWSRSRE